MSRGGEKPKAVIIFTRKLQINSALTLQDVEKCAKHLPIMKVWG
jgi:hypothetical protein